MDIAMCLFLLAPAIAAVVLVALGNAFDKGRRGFKDPDHY